MHWDMAWPDCCGDAGLDMFGPTSVQQGQAASSKKWLAAPGELSDERVQADLLRYDLPWLGCL